MVGRAHPKAAFNYEVDANGRPLSAQEREKLLEPYLPAQKQKQKKSTQPVRDLIKTSLHVLLFNLIHFVFSVYLRFRVAYHKTFDRIFAVLYYHHRTPDYIRKDVSRLNKLPKHLSIILEFDDNQHNTQGLDALVHDVCEVAAWSASAGIPMLSIYERSGILKLSLPLVNRRISRTLSAYFGQNNPNKPTISIGAPHMQSFSPPSSPPHSKSPPHLSILLLSASDGRRTLVDLTKTLAEMSQKSKLAPRDISEELIDAELSESVMGEPDLLILFGDSVNLQGYPPWQVRLTEIFHVQDNNGVGYQVFLRALYNFAKAQMRFGS